MTRPERRYTLAQLMALPCTPAQMLRLAADTGCIGAGIRIWPNAAGGFFHPLADDAAMQREARAVVADTGVHVVDLEVLRLHPDFDPHTLAAGFEAGASLGATHVLVTADDPDEARLTARYAELCAFVRPYGLTADLEFLPWSTVPDLRTAQRIAAAAAQPNAGLLVDALHFARSDSRLDELADVPREWLHYAQICDGAVPAPTTREALIHDARCERLLPGEGGIDLAALFAHLPADLTVSIEVPSDTRAPVMGYPAWARAAKAATLAVLGSAA